MTDDPAPLYLM